MKVLFMLIASLITTACSIMPKKDKPTDLYLRADFTYWEAKPEFKFKRNKDTGIQFLTADIKYDGNPYLLLVADKNWSENNNCGYKTGFTTELKPIEWTPLSCSYDYVKQSITPIQKPFKFDPKTSGRFLFELKSDVNTNVISHIRVSQIRAAKR